MRLFIFFIFTLFFASCSTPESEISSFEDFMGKNSSLWKFVTSPEDWNNLKIFKKIYTENAHFIFEHEKRGTIPQTIHFIWIGPRPFPQESIANVNSWVEKHPNWKFKFWTDRYRPLPHPQMETALIQHFQFANLERCFKESENFAEKSDLLRYEILLKEGGIYVDHDVKCFRSFVPLQENVDFFCGVEPPHALLTTSSISLCNNIIGTCSEHPILRSCIDLIKKSWDEIGALYPENDKHSTIYRVAQRTFFPFDTSVKEHGEEGAFRNLVLPAGYFNQIEGHFGLFAHHYYASTWFDDESKFEKNTRRALVKLAKKQNQLFLFSGGILLFNLLLLLFIGIKWKRSSR